MVLVVAFVLLSAGIPAGAHIWACLRPRRARARLGPGHNQIDNWLLQHHGLPPPEQEQVRAAVFEGRQVSSPALAAAASDLATKLLSKEIKVLPAPRVLVLRFGALAAAGLIAMGGLLILSHHAAWQALGLLSALTGGMLTAVNNMHDRRVKRIRKNASIALELSQGGSSANSADMDQARTKS